MIGATDKVTFSPRQIVEIAGVIAPALGASNTRITIVSFVGAQPQSFDNDHTKV